MSHSLAPRAVQQTFKLLSGQVVFTRFKVSDREILSGRFKLWTEIQRFQEVLLRVFLVSLQTVRRAQSV